VVALSHSRYARYDAVNIVVELYVVIQTENKMELIKNERDLLEQADNVATLGGVHHYSHFILTDSFA